MPGYAGGNVWGIGATGFLWGYWLAVVALLAPTVAYLARCRLGQREVDPDALSPVAVAYLAGGAWPALYASLAWLRASDAVTANCGVLATTGPPPWGAAPLDRAVYRAAARGAQVRQLASEPWVARAVRALREELERAGLAVHAWVRRGVVVATSVLLMVGAARFLAERIGGEWELTRVADAVARRGRARPGVPALPAGHPDWGVRGGPAAI